MDDLVSPIPTTQKLGVVGLVVIGVCLILTAFINVESGVLGSQGFVVLAVGGGAVALTGFVWGVLSRRREQ